jgi:subtilisin family serine protease
MFRRRSDSRRSSRLTSRSLARDRRASAKLARAIFAVETMESRVLLSAAFDITDLTAMRADPTFSGITGKGIGIAVLDTGVYAQNPDLIANVKAFYNAVLNPPSAPSDLAGAVDNEGHGSHVSGIAASSNPSIGVAYNANLIDVKVIPDTALGETQQAGDAIDNGLRWVLAHAATYNIKVVNMSIGIGATNVNSQPQLDIYGQDIQNLENAGITVVAASGNSYAFYASPGESSLSAEATIGVANTWPDNGAGHYNFTAYYGDGITPAFAFENSSLPDEFQATSQRSALFNQVAAPGTGIYSTWNSPTQLHNTDTGTSMASPFVAGVVALMQQAAQQFGGQYLAPQTILQILRNTADTISDPTLTTNGRVVVNADGSLSAPETLPGTGLTYDRINVLHAIEAVKALVQGGSVPTDANKTIATAINETPLNGKNSDIITGNIGTDGSVSIGVNDVDMYKVVVQTPGTLLITSQAPAGGVQFNEAMTLFDASGNVVYTAPGGSGTPYPTIMSAVGVPLQAGTYYLGVSSAGNVYNQTTGVVTGGGGSQGDYQITFTVSSPDPGGEPAAAETLGLTSPDTLAVPLSTNLANLPYTTTNGVLGEETLADGTVVQIPDGDVHFYAVVAPDTGNLLVEGTSDRSDAFIEAFDSSFNQVGTAGPLISIPVVSGQVYYIGVTDTANQNFQPNDPFTRSTGSTASAEQYTIYTAFDNGDTNGTISQATAQTIGSAVSGTIGSDPGTTFLGANGGNKDVDFYSFTSPTSGVFQVSASGSTGLSPQVSLWKTGSGISSVTQLASSGSGTLYEQVTAGQAVIVAVTGLGNQNFNGISLGSGAGGTTGTYSLTTSVQAASVLSTLSNNSINSATPTPVTLGTPVTGNIGLDGNLYVGPSDVDFYKFVAPSSREYQFATTTDQDNSADTFMRIFDSLGNQVAVNDNANATTTASSISLSMTAGQTYYIGISGAGSGALAYNALTGAGALPGSTGPYGFEVTDIGPFQRNVMFEQGKNLTFTDATGHKVTLQLTGPGTGTVVFFSVSGNTNIGQLNLTGTDTTSSLTLTGATPIGQVTITNTDGFGKFNARQAKLTGNFTDAGALKSLSLASASGGTISIGSGAPVTITIPTLTNENLTSTSAIKVLRASTWTTTGSTRSTLSAPSIQSLIVSGTFNEDVSATTIQKFNVGTLTASAIRASSSIQVITAGAATGSEIFAGVNSSVSGLPTAASQFTPAFIKTITVHGVFSNTQIAAFTIERVNIGALQPANGGTKFGIATNHLDEARIVANGTAHVFNSVFAPLAPISLGSDAEIELLG